MCKLKRRVNRTFSFDFGIKHAPSRTAGKWITYTDTPSIKAENIKIRIHVKRLVVSKKPSISGENEMKKSMGERFNLASVEWRESQSQVWWKKPKKY